MKFTLWCVAFILATPWIFKFMGAYMTWIYSL